ncbi:response regulator [Stigmatella erecta]|uniref:Response regulator receiver domain-containing protein n=1 Tax=Stigmatella erecta TaxID=83460 RepID=A0A1I0L728_9BACT|nr:response regulator [Stigmatella erecta]SEU35782.1 Response regulator receiver domain-containing protein [Stigmatella erecta]
MTPGRSHRLLLVEDDPGNRMTLAMLLEDEGFTVVTADSCALATRLLNDAPRYDAVLLDSRLGDGDGRSLIPLVRGQLPGAKLVLVTGWLNEEALCHAVDAVFQKGTHFDELLACLCRLLSLPSA